MKRFVGAALHQLEHFVSLGGSPASFEDAVYPPCWEEGISPFILANLKWLPAIYALDRLNPLTLLFPATTTAVNTAIIGVVLVRRAQLQARGASAAASADAQTSTRDGPHPQQT